MVHIPSLLQFALGTGQSTRSTALADAVDRQLLQPIIDVAPQLPPPSHTVKKRSLAHHHVSRLSLHCSFLADQYVGMAAVDTPPTRAMKDAAYSLSGLDGADARPWLLRLEAMRSLRRRRTHSASSIYQLVWQVGRRRGISG